MAGIKIDPEMLDIYMESLNKLMAGSETDGGNARLEVSGAGKTEDGLVQYNEEVNKLGDDLRELYETIRVNVDEEEQWKVFDFVEDFFMEELEIGDYINDINSYHLHMFDKHDVTTKKFDAIVEKAGKVDANYAAQIEGYCSLLGEYGKKFEAVCAMLQPEKLRLSPDKYREKLEGINTGYQNAKDTHEQEQSDYEAELYEIETVWYKKMLDKAEDYLIRSAECVVLGNFTDEVTVLGVGVQIVLGIFDLDLPCDIRDIIADIKNLAETDRVRWDLIGMLALDLIGLIPVIGALKYSDEIGTLFKNADKVSVVARSTDGAGVLAKHADEAGAWLHGGKVFRYSDETAEAVASGEKLLKESQTVYESFADMMSPDDAAKYLDFLENGSREGLTSAELAGVEKADALLVSQKVGYEDVWDLRNAGDVLETSYGKSREIIQCNTKDAAADELAKRIGGQSRSAFADDPIQREFDVISDQYIAQAKPPLKCVNKTVRTQMKATFEAAKKYERKVYYQFEGIPSQEVLDKLYEYSERYGVEVIIDTEPLEILN